MIKTFVMMSCLFCLSTSVNSSLEFKFRLDPNAADISASGGSNESCKSKKISGKVSPIPRLKCRFS